MKTIRFLLPISFVAACGSGDGSNDDVTSWPQCGTAEYIAFDPSNHVNQDIRVAAYVEMNDRMTAVESDVSSANAVFTDLETNVYTRADLREKVMGRTDDHFDPPRAVGTELDDAIMAGFAMGKTATTALDVTLARQAIDKTFVQFFYLSVFHEMVDGSRAHWDEAYGYYGAPSDGAEGGRKGFASVATKRDGTNSTNLALSIFNGIVDGSCALAESLDAANVDRIAVDDDAAVKSIIDRVDEDMLKVLAFSVGHEAFDMAEIQSRAAGTFNLDDANEMRIKLAELEPYFVPIERLMVKDGGDAAARAARIRADIEAALADDSTAWMSTFDAAAIITDLEAIYGIDIRG